IKGGYVSVIRLEFGLSWPKHGLVSAGLI
ncbi:hypothetical protein A2U01_0107728, partial [Trifolium medium]|nr:hypothetical protein [Trifolium medium]